MDAAMRSGLLGPEGAMSLRGRADECALLDGLLGDVRRGESRSLVVRGEAGIGKTALLEYLVASASDLQVLRAVGVESEMELPYASLHQLCVPVLDRLEQLPGPQREALEIVFALSGGAAPDRFLVALGTLTLLSEVAEERPLLCIVDDAQWLDEASALTLAFVARRMLAEATGIVFAAREPGEHLERLPAFELGGLADGDARALLESSVGFALDERVRDRVIAEMHGNPLALAELPRGLTATRLHGELGLPSAGSLSDRIEESFRRRLDALPADTGEFLLAAAADPVGDPQLLWKACERLGISPGAADAGETGGLLTIGGRVVFHHPLVRSAVYRAAAPDRRRAAHLALAEATDPEVDPDRRAWHLAAAANERDETVAGELERSAGRAQARGGATAAAAFLRRAVELTPGPKQRVDRALAAAQASIRAGLFEQAEGMLATAEAGADNEHRRASVVLLRGHLATAIGAFGQASSLLLDAAKRLEPLDAALARDTYLDAWNAGHFGGRLAEGPDMFEVSEAARTARHPSGPERPWDQLLDGLALLMTAGRTEAGPVLQRAVPAFCGHGITLEKSIRWGICAAAAAVTLWDFDSWDAVFTRQVELARRAVALDVLPIGLNAKGLAVAFCGDFARAEALADEASAVLDMTGATSAPFTAMSLAALRGDEVVASPVIDGTIRESLAAKAGFGVQFARWTAAILYNGVGRYEQALTEARRASEETPGVLISVWALPEMVEAAARTHAFGAAADALERLADATSGTDADWGAGILARSRALLLEGEAAESSYCEAIERLGRTRLRPELARAHLLYGEWLSETDRGTDARKQLRLAHNQLSTIGMDGFAERARVKLVATGGRIRKQATETRDELSLEELQIAELARDGLSNSEIGARMFLSARTIEWHLRKVYGKLAIRNRRDLEQALPASAAS